MANLTFLNDTQTATKTELAAVKTIADNVTATVADDTTGLAAVKTIADTVTSDVIALKTAGDTASRPSYDSAQSQPYLDTELGKPIWYNGSDWIDATGTTV